MDPVYGLGAFCAESRVFLCVGLLKVSLYEFKTFARRVCYQHGFLIFRHLFYRKYFLVGCQTIGPPFFRFYDFFVEMYTLFFMT
jgi:hypothetical protein